MAARTLLIEIIIIYILCAGLTFLDVLLYPLGSPISDIAWFAAMLSLFALPIVAVRYIHPRDEIEYGTHILWKWRDLCHGALAVLILLVPVALCNHYLRTSVLGLAFDFSWSNYQNLEMPIYELIPWQILCVALPEEFFYRGYIQTNIKKALMQNRRWGKYAAPAAIAIAAAAFALAHFPNGGAVRLLTFFPGLLFGFLREKSGGILGSIFCHAMCNTMMAVYNVHYLG